MKNIVIITAEELKDAALFLMAQKPQFFGKHTSTVEFVYDGNDPVPSRRIRIEVTLFDSEFGAKRYLDTDGKDAAGDALEAYPEPASTPADGNREGEKK